MSSLSVDAEHQVTRFCFFTWLPSPSSTRKTGKLHNSPNAISGLLQRSCSPVRARHEVETSQPSQQTCGSKIWAAIPPKCVHFIRLRSPKEEQRTRNLRQSTENGRKDNKIMKEKFSTTSTSFPSRRKEKKISQCGRNSYLLNISVDIGRRASKTPPGDSQEQNDDFAFQTIEKLSLVAKLTFGGGVVEVLSFER